MPTRRFPEIPRGLTSRPVELEPFWARRARHFISAIVGWDLYDLYRRAPATIEGSGREIGVGKGHRAAILTRDSINIPKSSGGSALIEGLPEWTVAVFFRFNSAVTTTAEDEIFGLWAASTAEQRALFRWRSNVSRWQFFVRDSSGTQRSTEITDTDAAHTEWQTLVCTLKDEVIRIYRVGKLIGSVSITDSIQTASDSQLWQYMGAFDEESRADFGIGLVSTEAWDPQTIAAFDRDPWGPVRRTLLPAPGHVTAANLAPTVTIDSPADGSSHEVGSVTLEGTATDAEDGDLSASIEWSSSIDGALGTGASISPTLSAGAHIITAEITDSGGKSDSDEIALTIQTGRWTQAGLQVLEADDGDARWTQAGLQVLTSEAVAARWTQAGLLVLEESPSFPNQPTIDATVEGPHSISVETSAYSHPDGAGIAGAGWQIATDSAFTTDVQTVTEEFISPSEAPDPPSYVWPDLDPSTEYFFRARHQDEHGQWSLWSAHDSATTEAASPLNTPSVTADPSYELVELTGSALSDPEDPDRTHVQSEWQVDVAAGDYSSPVAESLEDFVNLTSIILTGLAASTDYIARYRQRVDDGTWSSWSADEPFTTTADPGAGSKPEKPTVTLVSQRANAITLEGSAFSYPSAPAETHATTMVQLSSTAAFTSVTDQATFTPGQVEDLEVQGLSQGTLYYYRVRYRASDGVWSDWSDVDSTTTPDGVFDDGVHYRPVYPRHGAVVRGADAGLEWTPTSEVGVAFDVEISPAFGDEETYNWTSLVSGAGSSPQSWDTTAYEDGVYTIRFRASAGGTTTSWEYRTIVIDNDEDPLIYNVNIDEAQPEADFTPIWNTEGHTWDFQDDRVIINTGSRLSSGGWAALAHHPPAQPFDVDVIGEVLAGSTGGSFPWAWFAEQSWSGVGMGALNHEGVSDGAGLGIWASFYMLPIQAHGDCFYAGRGDGFLNIIIKDDVNDQFETTTVVVPLGKIHTLNYIGDCEKLPRYGVRLRVTTLEVHGNGTRTVRIQATVQGMEIDSDVVSPWHYDNEHVVNIQCGEACYVAREITTSRAYRSFTNLTVMPTGYGQCETSPEWEEAEEEADIIEKAWAFVLDGHVFYVLNFKDRPALVCDLTTGQWHSWFTRTFSPHQIGFIPGGYWNMFRGIMWNGRVIAADHSEPTIWELDPHSMLDESVDDIRRAVTAFQPLRGSASARQGSMRLTARKEALDESSTIRMRFSDDGGNTWSNWHSVTLAGNSYSKRIEWRSLGRIRAPGRIWEIEDAGGLVRIEGTDADLEGG